MINFQLWEQTPDGLQELSEISSVVLPRIGEYFVNEHIAYEVTEVTHDYDANSIDVTGRVIY